MILSETREEIIKARREQIEQDAPCEGCGATLAECKAERGKDPTAPEWFGCCVRGMGDIPCYHSPDPWAFTQLLYEIESGNVRTVQQVEDDKLLNSIKEYPRRPGWDYSYLQDAWEDATWD